MVAPGPTAAATVSVDADATATVIAEQIQAAIEATLAARVVDPTSTVAPAIPTLAPTAAPAVCPTPGPPSEVTLPEGSAGPLSGALSHESASGRYFGTSAGVNLRNLTAEVDFRVPPGDTWDFGILFHNNDYDEFEVVLVYESPTPRWEHGTYDFFITGDYDLVDTGEIGPGAAFVTSDCGVNNLKVEVSGTEGALYLNGETLAGLLPDASATGDVSVITGFHPENQTEGGITYYENFRVSPLE